MRIHATAACLCLAVGLGAAVASCGGGVGVATKAADTFPKRTVVVYSSLPTDGPSALEMASIELGEQLALAQAGGRAGRWRVRLAPLDDTDGGSWSPGVTAAGAHTASADANAVAYIGDFDSGATATSLQITNAGGALQLSPWSPYVGFTDVSPADDRGDPGRFQDGGRGTFARLIPSDAVQAEAMVGFMRSLGVRRLFVLEDVSDPFDADIAQLIANRAPPAITVVAQQPIDTGTNTQPQGYAAIAASVRATRADAVVFGGNPGVGAQALWSELHDKVKHVKRFAPSTLATPAFLGALGGVAAGTYVESPILQRWQYPPRARRVLAAYRRRFGVAPTPYALYGYEAMRDVLAAIARARPRAGTPAALQRAVLDSFFSLGAVHGAIGDYRIRRSGDTTLRAVDGYRVDGAGRMVFVRRIG